MKPRILITEQGAYPTAELDRLSEVFEVHRLTPSSQAEFASALQEVNPLILLVGLGFAVGNDEAAGSSELRFVVSPTTGIEHLQISELGLRGIRVITLQDMFNDLKGVSSTAELAWGLILCLARRIVPAVNSVSRGEWHRERFLGRQLRNKTLGVIGLGRLGQFLAEYGSAFGMNVLAVDPARKNPDSIAKLVRMPELLNEADVVSLHVPLNDNTAGLIGAKEIQAMKAGALLVNTSRGEVVDEDAVAAALRDGHLGGYGTDVLSGDSGWGGVVQSNPLTELMATGCNIVVTPHIGGYSSEAVSHTRKLVIDYILALQIDTAP